MKLKEIRATLPWTARLWPSRNAMAVHLYRLFGEAVTDGPGRGNDQDYTPEQVRIAATYQMMARAGLQAGRSATAVGASWKLREAIESAVWSGQRVSFEFNGVRLSLPVEDLVWREIAMGRGQQQVADQVAAA